MALLHRKIKSLSLPFLRFLKLSVIRKSVDIPVLKALFVRSGIQSQIQCAHMYAHVFIFAHWIFGHENGDYSERKKICHGNVLHNTIH